MRFWPTSDGQLLQAGSPAPKLRSGTVWSYPMAGLALWDVRETLAKRREHETLHNPEISHGGQCLEKDFIPR